MKGRLIKRIHDKNLIEIVSYGLKIKDKKTNKILLVKRRHTIEFINIVKCEWTPSQLIYLLHRITPEEKEKLLTLQNDNREYLRFCIDENINADIKYFQDMYDIFRNYLILIKPKGILTWSFPKGRPNKFYNENSTICALRELKEETGIDYNKVNIDIENTNWFEDKFYTHRSLIVKVRHKNAYMDGICDLYPQLSEIKEAKWISLDNPPNDFELTF